MWGIDRGGGSWEVVLSPRQVLIADINYPGVIFTAWTPEELAAIGIYPAVYAGDPPSQWHLATGETYAFADGRLTVTREWNAPDLASVKLDALARLTRRQVAVQDEDFSYLGSTFSGDERSRTAILIECIRAIYSEIHAQPYNVSLPAKDGAAVAMTRDQVIAFADTMATNYEAVQGLAIAKIAEINAAADIAAVQAALDSVGA